MCTGFHFAHTLASKHELVLGIKWVLAERSPFCRIPETPPNFYGNRRRRPLLEAGGRGLKEVKNEVNADVGGRGVWGRGDLSNAAPYRAERD